MLCIAGTTPTEETATAPFESRESGDNDFSSIAEVVRAEETEDDEDESSHHIINRHQVSSIETYTHCYLDGVAKIRSRKRLE